uniref:SFRICE_024509 n=1 Tax=Spodoptera frugiperda TaxID=7108 RepID=A0A2H1W3K4_SPOFR
MAIRSPLFHCLFWSGNGSKETRLLILSSSTESEIVPVVLTSVSAALSHKMHRRRAASKSNREYFPSVNMNSEHKKTGTWRKREGLTES